MIRGPQYRPPHAINHVTGTPKKRPLLLKTRLCSGFNSSQANSLRIAGPRHAANGGSTSDLEFTTTPFTPFSVVAGVGVARLTSCC